METIFSFEARVKLTLKRNAGKTSHVATDFNLELSDNLKVESYLEKDGTPNKDGSKAFTQTITQALIGNIHAAHQKGYIDSAEHLRFIIGELERGFVQQVNHSTTKQKFKS